MGLAMGCVRADKMKGCVLKTLLKTVLKKELVVLFCALGGMACGDLLPELSEEEKKEKLARDKVKVSENEWYEEPIAGVNHSYYTYANNGTFRFVFIEMVAGVGTKKSIAGGTWSMEIDNKMTLTYLAGKSDCEDSDRTVSGEYLFPGNGGFLFEPSSGGGRKLHGQPYDSKTTTIVVASGKICDYKN